jgi:putative DNA methylase
MTRMIERWFPCAEVSKQAAGGWGSGNSETGLFTWFAKRPLAQAKAAILTSLLPWPDRESEQQRLRELVVESLSGYASAQELLLKELERHYPDGARVLDPFCGRGILPLEAARLQAQAFGIDYAHMATLGARLLTDYPMRDWSNEPPLPFEASAGMLDSRLYVDAVAVIEEVGRRFDTSMKQFFPDVDGRRAWGYLWAISLPCQECGRSFPLVGNLALRPPNAKKSDPGQSFLISVDRASGTFTAVVHDGPPTGTPTRRVANGKSRYDASGKVAVCPFCDHVHPKDVHTRLADAGLGQDTLLIAADIDKRYGKTYRAPTDGEIEAAAWAAETLKHESSFGPGLAAVPDEPIPHGNTWTVQATADSRVRVHRSSDRRHWTGAAVRWRLERVRQCLVRLCQRRNGPQTAQSNTRLHSRHQPPRRPRCFCHRVQPGVLLRLLRGRPRQRTRKLGLS